LHVRRTGDRRKRGFLGPPIRRIARWAGVDRNPLRRGIDQVERALWVVLVLAFVVTVSLVVPLAGRAAKSAGLDQVRQERTWREVNAVLLRHAPNQVYGYNGTGIVWVSGRWRTPSGAGRYGLVPTTVGAPAGTVVKIWVDRSGQLTGGHPLTVSLVANRVRAIETLAGIAAAIAAAILAVLARWLTNRRRMTCWGIEWACFGPRWSTRR